MRSLNLDGQEQVECQPHPQAMESGRRDADKGGCQPIDGERAAYHVGHPTEATLPEAPAKGQVQPPGPMPFCARTALLALRRPTPRDESRAVCGGRLLRISEELRAGR